jgi:hypothetical protein
MRAYIQELIIVRWDNQSRPVWRFTGDKSLPDHMRRRPTSEEIAAYKGLRDARQ